MRSAWAAAVLAAAVSSCIPATAGASEVLVMGRDGAVHARDDRFLPRAQSEAPARSEARPAPAPAARSRAGHGPLARASAAKTRSALRSLLSSAAIDQATYDRAEHDYDKAIHTMRRLRGERRHQLRAVVSDLDGMAARGLLSAARLPALLATLERNVQWWTTGPLLAPGRRIEFSGSQIVWQHYADQGLQIQWLGTFGRANGLWQGRKYDTELGQLLDEALALAGKRAGGIAFEYLFPFDGGRPPWVSGLAQGTALSAFSRAAIRLQRPAYFEAARSALGIFREPPPQGVAQSTGAGTHYLQYSFARKLHVLNGFVQSLNGLHDFAVLANDDEGRALFAAGERELRAELPDFDTGGWSRYSQHRGSDLSYHVVLRDFLRGLCGRMDGDGEDGAPYCAMADRFTADLTTPPRVILVTSRHRPRAKHTARLSFTIDKPATVTLYVHRKGFARTLRARVGSGRRAFSWRPPRPGPYVVRLAATDLAGNSAATGGRVSVRK